MAFFRFIPHLLDIAKDPKLVSLCILIAAGGVWLSERVEARHEHAINRIESLRVKVDPINKNQTEILVTLKNIDESVKEVKAQLTETNARVWQIGRDVYLIKAKNSKEEGG